MKTKMSKRFFCLFLAVVMSLSLLPTAVFAEENVAEVVEEQLDAQVEEIVIPEIPEVIEETVADNAVVPELNEDPMILTDVVETLTDVVAESVEEEEVNASNEMKRYLTPADGTTRQAATQDELNTAVATANAGDTVEITVAGTYTLPNIPNNITIKGTVDGVVFEHTTSGSVASVPNGCTFDNVTFNFGCVNYHGFQGAGDITMKNCILNGKFFSYGNMTFTGCTFNGPDGDYCMWLYGKQCSFTDCIFYGHGKFFNVYNEGNGSWVITASGCTFNSDVKNKAAFNVKDSCCNNNQLYYDVSISNCSVGDPTMFPAAGDSWDNGDGTTGLALSPLVQVDDVKTESDVHNITVYLDGVKVYENGAKVEAKKLPVAEVTTYDLTNPEHLAALAKVVGQDGFPICDFSNGVSLSGSGLYTLQIPDCAYKFAATEEVGESDYGNWFADYTISFDKPVAKDSMGLVGYYGTWGIGLGFLAPRGIPANVEIPLLNTMMNNSNWTYNQIIEYVGEFYCGAFNLSSANNDTTMTVKLRIFDPDNFNDPELIQNSSAYIEGENTYTIKEIQYKLTKNGAIPKNAVDYTVAGTADEGTPIPAGKFYIDSGEMVKAEEAVNVNQLTAYFTDGKSVVVVDPDDPSKETTVTTEQTSSVDDKEIPAGLNKEEVEASTSVSGVELKTTEGVVSGVQQIVNEALKTEKVEAIKAADEIKVEVDVVVTPTGYEAENTLKFDLTPVATVIAKSGDSVTATVEGIKVTNEMIDQTQNITVNIFSDFEPKTVIHIADDGEQSVYTKGQTPSGSTFVYDETAKKVTLIIHHFSNILMTAEPTVAMIGAEPYSSLAEAVAAAQSGDTIKLLQDATGDGIKINKSLTIDLNNYTYTVNGNLTGSTGTKTQAFQLLAGNNVTIKNGTITTTAEAQAKMLIQNYSNLTLDNVKLDGTNLIGTKYTLSNNNGNILFKTGTKIIAAEGGVAYDLYDWASGSTAYTGVSLTIEEDVTVTGKVEVGGDRDVLNVKVKAPETMLPEAPADYKWVDGEDGAKVLAPKTYVAQIGDDKYESLAEAIAAVPENGQTATEIKMIADETNAKGISVSGNKNFTVDFQHHTYTVNKPGAGSTNTKTQAFQLLKGSTIVFQNGTINVAAENKDYTWTGDPKGIAFVIQNYCDLTLDNMTVDGTNVSRNGGTTPRYVLSVNNGTTTIKNTTTITAANGDFAFDSYYDGNQNYTAPTVNVTGTSVINGKVEATGGIVTLGSGTTVNGQVRVGENKEGTKIKGSDLTIGTGATVNGVVAVFGVNTLNVEGTVKGYIATNGNAYNAGSIVNIKEGANIVATGDGIDVSVYIPNGTLNITGGTITGETAVYFKSTNLNITGGTIIGTGAKKEYKFDGNGCAATGDALVIDSCNYPNGIENVSISGGQFKSTHGVAVMAITKDETYEPVTKFVSGGLFSQEVDASYIVEGKACVANTDDATKADYPYTIGKAVAQIGDVKYATLAEAFAAALKQNGDYDSTTRTITLLDNVTVDQKINVSGVSDTAWKYFNPSIDLDMNGHDISTGETNDLFRIEKATLKINGTGTINLNSEYGKGEYYGIEVVGTTQNKSSGYTELEVNDYVTIKGGDTYGVAVMNNNGYANGVTVRIGEPAQGETGNVIIDTNYGVTVNGQIKNVTDFYRPDIVIGKVATVKGGLYLAGYANTVVAGKITGEDSGIAIKAGKLYINNGAEVTCTGEDTTPTAEHSSGVNASGAAIQIESNIGYAGNIMIDINNGAKVTSENGVAIYEYVASGTTESSVKSIKINGGMIGSGADKTSDFMVSEQFDKTGFISGGLFSQEVDAAYIVEGQACVVNTDDATKADYPYTIGKAVAQIIGGQKYETLQAALDAAKDNDTVTLLTSVTESVLVRPGKILTLDMAGFTLTESSDNTISSYNIDNQGTLTIIGNGFFVDADDGDNSSLIRNLGTMTIENGTFTSKYGCNVVKNDGDEKNVNGENVHTSYLTINGGTFKQETENAQYSVVNSWTDVTINGGEFIGNGVSGSTAISSGGDSGDENLGKLTITNGTFTNFDYVIKLNNGYGDCGDAMISGGKFIGKLYMADETGSFAISGGLFSSEVDAAYIVEGKACVANTDETTLAEGYLYTIGEAKTDVDPVKPIVDEKEFKEASKENIEVPVGAQEGVPAAVVDEVLSEITKNEAVTAEGATNIQSKEVEDKLQNVESLKSLLEKSEQLKITVKSVAATTEKTEVSAISAKTVTTTKATYDVEPWVTIQNGDQTETRKITNDELREAGVSLKFRLAVPASMGDVKAVQVIHYDDPVNNPSGTDLGLRQVQGISPDRYVELASDHFSEFELKVSEVQDVVAKNVGSGKVYTTLTAALKEAKDAGEDQEVQLLADISDEEYVTVKTNVTLDLAGHNISGATMMYVTGSIKDSMTTAATKGIVSADGYVLPRGGDGEKIYLPVYNGTGYQFYDLAVANAWDTNENDQFLFALQKSDTEAAEVYDALKLGRAKAVVTVTWDSQSGISGKQTFTFSDSLLIEYANAKGSKALYAKFTGLESLTNAKLQGSFEIYNETTNMISSINGALISK